MPRIVNKYRVYCTDEDAYFNLWSDIRPTQCPNNSAHVISDEMTTIIDKVSDQEWFITSKSYQGTQGYYMMEGKQMIAPTGQNIVTIDHVYQYPVCVFGLTMHATDAQVQDTFDVVIAPDTCVGVVTQDVTAGTTVLHVNPTVIQHITTGFYVALQTNNLQSEYVRVVVKDETNSTISIESGFAASFTAGSYVLMCIYVVKNFCLCYRGEFAVGYGTMAGKTIPTGAAIRILYHNKTGNEKEVSYVYEYTY